MKLRSFAISIFALAALLLPACTGGGSAKGNFNAAACNASGANLNFCLRSCSLGCVAGGCQVTEIAQNQPIILEFSQDVDPASVTPSSISIKTANGEVPVGRFEIDGNKILFLPELRISGGRTLFGFGSGKTYLLSLPTENSGSGVLRSSSGDPLSRSINCSVAVTQGIVDLNAAPPKATLVTPTLKEGVPANSVIVIKFDEFIDVSPFDGSTTQTSPITYIIRKTRDKPGGGGLRECDPNFTPLPLEGLPKAEINASDGTTTVTLKPSAPLPSQVCVQIEITNRVRDLAGNPAENRTFEFTTKIVSRGPAKIVETFASSNQLDDNVSSGVWGSGKALPPQIGGTGIHGAFEASVGKLVEIRDPAKGNQVVDRFFEWSTDSQKIPGTFTQSGNEETVTGGVFHFTNFFLPSGVKVVFKGANPAILNVRGKCEINGTIQVNAPSLASLTLQQDNSQPKGQAAGAAGPGGGKGGKGGDGCDNKGAKAAYAGANGEDVQLASGHAYASTAVKTGGGGTPLYPTSGKLSTATNSPDYDALGVFSAYTATGGSGGGFNTAGKQGLVSKVPPGPKTRKDADRMGPKPVAGKIFDIGGLTPKTTSLDHYLAGGSGGGGGCSHPLLTTSTDKYWVGGAAGAGGAGRIAFRVGSAMTMKSSGLVEAKGGSAASFNGISNFANVPCPGGGGSGGTILAQVGGSTSFSGTLDTSGGKGGLTDNSKSTLSQLPLKTEGGDGAPGYIRLETIVGARTLDLGTTKPAVTAKNVGKLTDSDTKTATQSKFYSTSLTFPPTFTSYVLEANVDGKRRVYSDIDLSATEKDYAGRATQSGPVWFRVQGAKVSTVTGLPDLSTLGPWRDFVTSKGGVSSINKDLANGFRFQVVFDRTNTTTIELLNLTVNYTE